MTREPEWDDLERAKMQGLDLYESQVCECGLHQSIADADPEMELNLPVCPVCAGLAQQMRVLNAEDEKALSSHGEKVPPGIKRPEDGRRISLRFKSDPSLEQLAGKG